MDIYEKWQRKWEESRIFEADPDSRPKVFINGAYPYVNGRPHLGHFFSTFLRPDVYARYKRMKGFNVLYPQGFHATGQPIAAAARRIREGDPTIRKILALSGVPEEEFERFGDPKYWIDYFMGWWIRDLKKAVNSIDWLSTFHTSDFNPAYDKFIRWQYRKLRELGLIEKGTHPVVWCPHEEIPIADHDRLDGEGVVPEEVVAIKFELEGEYLVTVTFRPETVYGVTNIWVNPEAKYVEVDVGGERWIVAEESYRRLHHQMEMKVVREVPAEELIGKRAVVPVDGRKVPVLPATFVDPAFGTGVVMSVPAHAPYDWIAVEEIKREAEKYGVDPAELTPISLIELEGYSEYPAADAVKKYGVTSQEDREALDRATEEIYRKEFYEGRLKGVFGRHAGKTVQEAKEDIIRELVEKGYATTMWILPERVVCRCGAEGVVKVVEQWFLRYSDEEWKEKARRAAEETEFTPPEAKNAVFRTIDWLREWPLTRDVRTSLGTRLPWDETQYIESLSDSTIYMAYYTIAKWLEHPERYGIDIEKIDDSFFDWVFLGKGDPAEISERTGIPERLLHEMREEFLYWYPTDVRFVGKDLIQNHVTFTIFHHSVLLPGYHPRRWSTAGHVTMDGQKMSKSKGNFVNLGDAVEDYGADPVRFAVAYAGNTVLDDANIESKVMEEMKEDLPRWLDFVVKWYGGGREERRMVDSWFEARVSEIISEVDRAYEELRLRDAAVLAWYEMWRTVKKYLQITRENPNREVFSWAIESWIKILQPIVPHFAEEAWERIGKEPFVSLAPWPEAKEMDERYARLMDYAEGLLEDIKHVIRLAKVEEPKVVEIHVAEEWMYPVMKRVKGLLRTRDVKRIMEAVPPEHRGELAKLVQRALKDPSKIPDVIATREEERRFLEELREYFEESVGVRVVISGDPAEGKLALPFKPAIVVR